MVTNLCHSFYYITLLHHIFLTSCCMVAQRNGQNFQKFNISQSNKAQIKSLVSRGNTGEYEHFFFNLRSRITLKVL